MNFFKSVFADEPDSPKSESEPESTNINDPDSDLNSTPNQQQQPPPNPNADETASAWSFGGLIKTITTKSESVIEIYRRDLKEFSSGLKKEIEVAHGSLETVGHAIDEIGSSVLKGTAQIISQGKDAILASDDHESDSSDNNNNNERSISSQQSLHSKPYSRFDAQVRAIQGDVNTYCEEPEDVDDFNKWKLGFDLEERRNEFEWLMEENGAMGSLYKRVVPSNVDEATFWCRYYYKVFKLKQAEDLRANLVKRAISAEEEDLSWDVDDEEEEEKPVRLEKNDDLGPKHEEVVESDVSNRESEETLNVKEEEELKGEKKTVNDSDENVCSEKVDLEKSKEVMALKSDAKIGSEGKGDNGESSKDSDVSVISSHPSMPEEEDLGWDEIEDLSSIDEKKVSNSDSPNKADLRKRLSAAEEEEDLSWDIEDDDEPIRA